MEFEDLLIENNIDYRTNGQHHHARHGWIQFDCPFCGNGTGKYHMGYNIEYNYVNCWSCGGHDLVTTLSNLVSKQRSDINSIIRRISTRSLVTERARRVKLEIPTGIKPLKRVHKQYLRKRGFDPVKLIELWNIQGFEIHEKLSWRIYIPITYHGEVVSWTTRSTSDNGVRYISAKDEKIKHKEILYGSDYARYAIIITEGPFDVWRIGPGAVCTFGTSYTQSQILEMLKYPKRIVCFDPEAHKEGKKLADTLSLYPGETWLVDNMKNDPGSSSEEDIKRLRELIL